MISLRSQQVRLHKVPCVPPTQIWRRFVIGTVAGVIGLELLGMGIGISGSPAIAQVVLDGSLGPSGSLSGPNYRILESYGVVVDQNLFHSFWQFNLPNVGDRASFLSSSGIRNILARVTGGTQSYLNGQINAGAVNLFLINPSGIIFGPNGSLNVGGSFIASTLDTAVWPSGAQFSASDFHNPQTSLLSFAGDPSGFLASLQPPGPVGVGYDLLSTGYSPSTTRTNLSVPDGQSLLFIGGDAFFNKADLTARGGRIDVAAVSPWGSVDLTYSSQGAPIVGQPSNISGTRLFSTDSYLDVSATGSNAGTIQLQAGLMDLANTTLDAGSFAGASGTSGFAGKIYLTGWDQISLRNNSWLYADSTNDDFGNWGVIAIEALAGSVTLDNTYINSQNFGSAYAGDIVISGFDRVNIVNNSQILSSGNNGRIAIGGGLTARVEANEVTINGSTINTRNPMNAGSAGYISISAWNRVNIFDSTINNQGSDGEVSIGENTTLNVSFSPSTVNIVRSTIAATLDTQPSSSPTAGKITITAFDRIGITDSNITSTVDSSIDGTAGTINLLALAGDVALDNVTLSTSNNGTGVAGNIDITGQNVSIFNSDITSRSDNDLFTPSSIAIAATAGSTTINSTLISTTNFGFGQTTTVAGYAGDIAITATDQLVIGNNSSIYSRGNFGLVYLGASSYNNFSPDRIIIDLSTLNTTNDLGIGQAGNITVTALGQVSIQNNSTIYSNMDRDADAGNILIQGNGGVAIADSEITSKALFNNSTGDAGNITIAAASGAISVARSLLNTSTENGSGVAGTININGQSISILTSDITSRSNNNLYAFGTVDLTATAGSLTLSNTLVSTSNFGNGFAGDISLTARDQVALLNNTDVYSQGNSGRIFIGAGSYSSITPNSVVIDQSTVQTNSLGTDFAGDIGISATNQVAILNNSKIFSQGNLGRIFIGASQFAAISPQTLTISNSELNTVNADPGRAGDISLVAANQLSITNSQIFSDTAGVANAGQIMARAGGDLAIANSQITSSVGAGAQGNGGTINLYGHSIFLSNGAQVKTSTAGTGNAGNINVYAINQFNLDGAGTGLFATTELGSSGSSGSIFVDPISVSISNGAGISVNSQGSGNGGNLTLYAGNLTLSNGAFLTAATASGQGGNINLLIQNLLLLRHGSLISATAGGTGNGGNINLAAQFVVSVPGENSDIIANAFQGKGGNINISTQGLFGIGFRPRLTPLSDITASSDFGLQGTVAINTPDVDVQSALSQLAGNFVNPDQLVAGSCIARRNVSQGSFVVTGTGGLPTTPYDQGISGRYEVMGIRGGAIAHTPPLPSTTSPTTSPALPTQPPTSATAVTWKSGDPINEASGLTVTTDGRKFLGSWEQARAIASPDRLICQ